MAKITDAIKSTLWGILDVSKGSGRSTLDLAYELAETIMNDLNSR